uniref:Uncharacterized protein n=1 Tax=Anopheles dirus TaxID=7168 RepID=A0A182NA14_9DIPT
MTVSTMPLEELILGFGYGSFDGYWAAIPSFSTPFNAHTVNRNIAAPYVAAPVAIAKYVAAASVAAPVATVAKYFAAPVATAADYTTVFSAANPLLPTAAHTIYTGTACPYLF